MKFLPLFERHKEDLLPHKIFMVLNPIASVSFYAKFTQSELTVSCQEAKSLGNLSQAVTSHTLYTTQSEHCFVRSL